MSILTYLHVKHRKHPYPAQTFWMRVLDVLVYVVGIGGPLATIPQVIQIYSTHNVTGVSLLTWTLYAFADIPLVIYAYTHKTLPLIISYTLWFLFNSAVAVGVYMYGGTF